MCNSYMVAVIKETVTSSDNRKERGHKLSE